MAEAMKAAKQTPYQAGPVDDELPSRREAAWLQRAKGGHPLNHKRPAPTPAQPLDVCTREIRLETFFFVVVTRADLFPNTRRRPYYARLIENLADRAAVDRLATLRADQEHVLAEIAAKYEHLMMQAPAVAIKAPSYCRLCGSELVGRRSDTLYCTNACRQRGYRQRLVHRALAAA